jgi:hypothetical protein
MATVALETNKIGVSKTFFHTILETFPSNLTAILLKDPVQGQIGRS